MKPTMCECNQVIDLLDRNAIEYKLMKHPPVYTIKDMENYGLDKNGEIPKNLFLRNANGKQHYIVVIKKDKNVNLKGLRDKIGCTALSFGSKERLRKNLDLEQGAVTPFGVINDEKRHVIVIFDNDLKKFPLIGIHPNHNEATVFVEPEAVIKIIKDHGNTIIFITI